MTRIVLVAAGALFDSEHRVLLAERPSGKSMAGLWELPGGKVVEGETPEAALVRELDEELGIIVTRDSLVPLMFASHTYPDFHLLMPLFLVRAWRGTPVPREGQRLRWLRPDAIDAVTLPPADVPLLAPLAAYAALRPTLSG